GAPPRPPPPPPPPRGGAPPPGRGGAPAPRRGAPPPRPAALLERLDAQAERNAERIRQWIDEGLLAPLDPYHLLLNLWAMTESYALGGWQLARLTGQAGLDASDYRQAAENIVRLVCAGCLALPGEAAPRRRFRALAG
ncbi:TetR family transcriptional regulator C-terminal domain-containing protein, partial [Pseudomonas aeruginosa]|uniref:TetR family transcriptional regulator C-terminal domain-containing protein n=1 Tax=Pseudomonas aeruginosa TaxID=287 RepID=UPI0021F207D6